MLKILGGMGAEAFAGALRIYIYLPVKASEKL